MNDDFFNFLVATDTLDEFLGYEPKCPTCGKILKELIKDHKKIYTCPNCKKNYNTELKPIKK